MIIVIFLRFLISVRGGHYDYAPRVPQNLATPLFELNKEIENLYVNEFLCIFCHFISRLAPAEDSLAPFDTKGKSGNSTGLQQIVRA